MTTQRAQTNEAAGAPQTAESAVRMLARLLNQRRCAADEMRCSRSLRDMVDAVTQ